MTISQLTEAMRSGTLTSHGLVSDYLSRICANKRLNAVLELNPDALAIAQRLDAAKDKPGALHGVPILLKDNISTADSMHTSAGSIALAENIAPQDAPIVRRLREAGAVLLGKTNMTEFANYMTHDAMPNGYSSRGGQTLSPFDPQADPSGSSTGSAVAVAAGLCAAAIGTETCGSIISPAQCAGIVGIKPTIGLVASDGIIPISFTLDTAGPMAPSVQDAGVLLRVLAGREFEAPAFSGLAGIRVGVCRMHLDGVDAEWINANEELICLMRDLGADCIDLPDHGLRVGGFLGEIMRYEFKFGMDRYLRSMNNPAIPQSLGEIIAYNERHADLALKYGQDALINANDNASGTLRELEYMEALRQRDTTIRQLDALFDEHRMDVFFMLAGNSPLAAATGFPSLTIPVGKSSKGLPIGCYFVARRYGEGMLLRVAAEIEKRL